MGVEAMTLYRLARGLHLRGVPWLPELLCRAIAFLHRSHLPPEAELGEGTQLGAGGGVVIHRATKVGRHCLICQGATLGERPGRQGAPVIGDYVRIGAGAKILGELQIGDFAVVRANAVVLGDVPPGAVVTGVPARPLRRAEDPLTIHQRELGLLPRQEGAARPSGSSLP